MPGLWHTSISHLITDESISEIYGSNRRIREKKKEWWEYQLLSSWTPLDSAETCSTRWFASLQTRIHTPVQTHLRAVQELLEDQRRLRSADCRRLSSTLNDLDSAELVFEERESQALLSSQEAFWNMVKSFWYDIGYQVWQKPGESCFKKTQKQPFFMFILIGTFNLTNSSISI